MQAGESADGPTRRTGLRRTAPGRSPRDVFVLTTRGDVVALRHAARRLRLRSGLEPISVRVSGLSPGEARGSERRLNEAGQDCGCSTGSAFVWLAVLACIVYFWMTLGSPLRAGSGQLLTAGAVLLAFGVLGKLVGVARATLRLERELAWLARRLAGDSHAGS